MKTKHKIQLLNKAIKLRDAFSTPQLELLQQLFDKKEIKYAILFELGTLDRMCNDLKK